MKKFFAHKHFLCTRKLFLVHEIICAQTFFLCIKNNLTQNFFYAHKVFFMTEEITNYDVKKNSKLDKKFFTNLIEKFI